MIIQMHRVTPPAKPVLTLAEARAQCRIDALGSPPVHEDDELLGRFVAGATAELEGMEGWLGRALLTQTWRLTLPGFPRCGSGSHSGVPLPLPPLQSVTSIGYTDPDGVEQTLAGSAYRVITEARVGRVEPVYGTSWPSTRTQSDAVKITFTCGYGADETDVPEDIRNYVRARTGQLYEHRELVIAGTIIAEVPHMRNSLESRRVHGVLGQIARLVS